TGNLSSSSRQLSPSRTTVDLPSTYSLGIVIDSVCPACPPSIDAVRSLDSAGAVACTGWPSPPRVAGETATTFSPPHAAIQTTRRTTTSVLILIMSASYSLRTHVVAQIHQSKCERQLGRRISVRLRG